MPRLTVRRTAALLLVAPLLAAVPPGVSARAGGDGLPLGPPGLPETRHAVELAPGLTYTDIVRGMSSKRSFWTITVGVTATHGAAERLLGQLRAAGYDGRIQRLDRRAPDDPDQTGPLGFAVRTGHFATEDAALVRQARLTAAGFTTSVNNTAEDGTATTGPWVVHVLRIDVDRFAGRVRAALSTGVVPGLATVSATDASLGALAGVNGGFFVIDAIDGTPGDLAGVSVVDGQLVSEAVRGRTALVLPAADGAGARIERVSTRLTVRSSDGSGREVDGLNRASGLIRSCGGVGGDQPTQRPLHDVTCTDSSELIVLRRVFGASAPDGDGVEAAVDPAGRVRELRDHRGGPIPVGGAVLQGTGSAADWLRQHARPGLRIRVEQRLGTPLGVLPLTPALDVVNGGPRLLGAGRTRIDAFAEGFVHPDDPGFYWAFGVRRNPRTMAGLTRDGDLLLVTSDGRAPGYSVGLSFAEEARVMRALGARSAVNLDGGGSTTMVVGDRLVTRPSDPTGERPVGDAVVLLPDRCAVGQRRRTADPGGVRGS